MPSVFISYSHDPADPTHAERVVRLAASLLDDGLEMFFDQNRGDEEEGLRWPIWMEDKIDVADHVLLVCTEKPDARKCSLLSQHMTGSSDRGNGVSQLPARGRAP